MPNVENCQLLLDTLRSLPEIGDDTEADGFSMAQYKHACGTPSCMAGYAAWLKEGKPKNMKTKIYQVFDAGAEWLGINYDTAEALFIPYKHNKLDEQGISTDDITPQEAAEVLQNYLDGGVVDWYAVLVKRYETPAILGDSFGDPGSV
jgi:hypothetical protein